MGLFSATAIVMGSMIGSGIFIVSADMSRVLGSPALLIAAWLVTAAMTIIGALSYGELAAMMPRAGGQYVYLRESLGPIWGFLYGWTLFLVIQTGTIAAVGVAFGKFLGVFFPSVSAGNWIWHGPGNIGLNTANLVAIVVVTLLTVANTFGVKLGAAVQNLFTSAKVLALAAVVSVGLVAKNATAIAANFSGSNRVPLSPLPHANFWLQGMGPHSISVGAFFPGTHDSTTLVSAITAVAVVQVGSLFSSDAWNNVTFTAGEIRNPKRNLPLSLALGTGVVLLLYILCNFVYLSVLPLAGDAHATDVVGRGISYAAQDRVATAVMEKAFGGIGAKLMAGAILISTFGCVNGMLLAGARVYYAMSRDGLFFKATGKLSARGVPVNSLWIQWGWTCLLCLSGSYGQLLDYVIFAVLIFYILTIVGLFVLRRTQPDAPRPYRAFGYPVLPALYIVMASWISVVLLRYKPQYTWPGLILVVLGVPVYLVWSRSKPREA
ncbi:amino acid/polyamine/organocation transporter, APC superfamily [Granulicella rosea]|uniref:Amino acid/polyamine/organocation transporter, APC superfamily n=1 Tax=Granulicella rosea TaxID=474952 RepID=A0A239HPQ9_9BACT|nr:amino acid permease [Granulicella rosea]SNS83339.1 amino acid/polyamine/organocation transporter, APC superfamily [Granulicella rosea]